MEIIRLNQKKPDSTIFKRVKEYLDLGKIIAHPTDTIYGLATNILNDDSVQRIFDIKGRDPQKPISLMVKDIDAINELIGTISDFEKKFIEHFLPGSVTVILPIRKKTEILFLKNRQNLGIRIPNHKFTFQLLQTVGYPLCTTSANKSGYKDPVLAMEIISHFQDEIDLLIDGGMTKENIPSTIVDLSGKSIKILREGPVPADDIYKFIKQFNI